jgi:hypothetical protein
MSAKQIVILTAAVVSLVVIATLAKVYLGGIGGKERGVQQAPPVLANPHLTFPQARQTASVWVVTGPANPFDATRPPDEEAHSDGHYDFWFKNEDANPVDVFVAKLSCNRCLHLEIALAPEGWQAAQGAAAAGLGPVAAAAGAAQAAQAAQNPPVAGPDTVWQTLESEEVNREAKSFTVPPKRGGWARLAWRDEEAGGKLLSIDLRTVSPSGNAPPIHLQYGAIFIEPVRVVPETKFQTVGDINGGDRPREAWFTVFSSTRTAFKLDPESDDDQKKKHPFAICGKPVPLTRPECDELQKEQKRAVTCGYKVPVTVYERLEDGREHDLGPFRWVVPVKSDVMDATIGLSVAGSVLGNITVLSDAEANRDRVEFGTFPRSREATKKVTVEAPLDTDLKVDKAPAVMKVELTPEEKTPPGATHKTWSLTVTLPPDKISGHFPDPDNPEMRDTAIYLMAKSRRVRIPVSGTASQR